MSYLFTGDTLGIKGRHRPPPYYEDREGMVRIGSLFLHQPGDEEH